MGLSLLNCETFLHQVRQIFTCWIAKSLSFAGRLQLIQTEILEGSLHNLQRKFSWFSNKLLKLRDVVFTWMKRRVRDGNTTRFWSDNWTPFRSLLSFLATSCRPSRLGISQNTTVSSIFHNGYWALPPARSDSFVNLQTYLTTVQLSEGEDTYEWVIEDIPKKATEIDPQRSWVSSTSQIYRIDDTIVKMVDRLVCNKISSFRKSNPSMAMTLLQQWLLTA
ncbi:unnamed protein product [Thlaspi arvense]|uniref:Uncharacterized protein n=1 Tax=Thlaspi arvense TaxID=13288 RepID=A0AAU9SHL6_THLAR|nr:unnamed protein product [Thlaspi arvense]